MEARMFITLLTPSRDATGEVGACQIQMVLAAKYASDENVHAGVRENPTQGNATN